MQQYTLKIGANRGNPRIRIEGQRLIDAGLPCGTKLYRSEDIKGDMVLSTYERGVHASCHRERWLRTTSTATATERLQVAGKADHPVLDLCGKWVTAFMGEHTHIEVCVVRYDEGTRYASTALLISPTNAAERSAECQPQ
jgi:hypothetical protein